MAKKQWYTVSFSAKMTEEDVRAMQNCFYQAMEEAMQISPCAALDIELEDDQDVELVLSNDDYELDEETGNILVDRIIFDAFEKGAYVDVYFDDEDKYAQYKMISEDVDGIVMEYIKED